MNGVSAGTQTSVMVEEKKQASIREWREISEFENIFIFLLSPLSALPGNHCFWFEALLFLTWIIAKTGN